MSTKVDYYNTECAPNSDQIIEGHTYENDGGHTYVNDGGHTNENVGGHTHENDGGQTNNLSYPGHDSDENNSDSTSDSLDQDTTINISASKSIDGSDYDEEGYALPSSSRKTSIASSMEPSERGGNGYCTWKCITIALSFLLLLLFGAAAAGVATYLFAITPGNTNYIIRGVKNQH